MVTLTFDEATAKTTNEAMRRHECKHRLPLLMTLRPRREVIMTDDVFDFLCDTLTEYELFLLDEAEDSDEDTASHFYALAQFPHEILLILDADSEDKCYNVTQQAPSTTETTHGNADSSS